eukprot:3141553-Pleurochrysis_carterae.AAC.1
MRRACPIALQYLLSTYGIACAFHLPTSLCTRIYPQRTRTERGGLFLCGLPVLEHSGTYLQELKKNGYEPTQLLDHHGCCHRSARACCASSAGLRLSTLDAATSFFVGTYCGA